MKRPQAKEKWRLKTNHSKVLTVAWSNNCDYVQFHAPWMKVCQDWRGDANKHFATGCRLKTFLNRYEFVSDAN